MIPISGYDPWWYMFIAFGKWVLDHYFSWLPGVG